MAYQAQTDISSDPPESHIPPEKRDSMIRSTETNNCDLLDLDIDESLSSEDKDDVKEQYRVSTLTCIITYGCCRVNSNASSDGLRESAGTGVRVPLDCNNKHTLAVRGHNNSSRKGKAVSSTSRTPLCPATATPGTRSYSSGFRAWQWNEVQIVTIMRLHVIRDNFKQ